jgi:hypothetical protein
MAAGQGYIEFATGDVLTAAAANGYLASQVVMVFASSAARTSAITSPQEGMLSYLKDTNAVEAYDGAAWISVGSTGDITGVTAGTGISGGGTSGTVTVTNSMATAITTAGDLIKGTGSGTFDRLGIGSTGQVLTVSAGAPAWSTPAGGGGMTLLSTTTLSGATTTISSIDQTYKNLYILMINGYGSTSSGVKLVLNGNTTAADYRTDGIIVNGASVGSMGGADNSIGVTTTTSAWNNMTYTLVQIPRYAETENKMVTSTQRCFGDRFYDVAVVFNSTTAITSVGFNNVSGTWSAGTVYVYGVK